LTIFGTNIPDTTDHQMAHPSSVSALPGETEQTKYALK